MLLMYRKVPRKPRGFGVASNAVEVLGNERMAHRAAQQPKQAGGLAAGQKSEKVGESVGRRAAGSCAGWEYLPESSPTNESTVVKVLKSHIAKNKSSKKFPPPVWKYRKACKCF